VLPTPRWAPRVDSHARMRWLRYVTTAPWVVTQHPAATLCSLVQCPSAVCWCLCQLSGDRLALCVGCVGSSVKYNQLVTTSTARHAASGLPCHHNAATCMRHDVTRPTTEPASLPLLTCRSMVVMPLLAMLRWDPRVDQSPRRTRAVHKLQHLS
jgi:hypothetical protein